MKTAAILALAGALTALFVLGVGTGWAGHRSNNEVLVGGAISQTGQYAEPAGRQVYSIKLWVDGHRPKDVPDPIDSPSEVAQAREVLGRLRELMPAERRSILELKAEGLSSKDIGERLGISERTVQRVLEELRRRMETEWGSP